MKQSTTPVVDDKTFVKAHIYIDHGQSVIAKSTYEGLRGALKTCNARRILLFLGRAFKHDVDIMAIAEAEGMLQKAKEHEELIIACKELGQTLRHFRGDVSTELQETRDWKLLELPQVIEADDFDAMSDWLEQAGMILLAIDDYNQPENVAQRLFSKLSVGKELICTSKQKGYQNWLDQLENLLLLGDRVELLMWINKARNHIRCLERRAVQGIPNTVGDRRRKVLESAQLAFRTAG